jgi:hypothetical protein
VVGASRQRAAPRSQFVGAPPALRLLRLALAVQAALWATARASPPPRCLPPQPWQRPCTGSNSSIASAAWRGLTCRSTGASTAWHLGRDPLSVHVAPRGPGAMPFRPGYLYVRPHVRARTGASSLEAIARQPQSPARFGSAGDRLGPSRPMLCVAASPTFPRRHHRALRAGIRQLRLGPSAGQLWLALRASVLRRAVPWSAWLAPCRRRNEPLSRQVRSGGSFFQLSRGQAAVHRPSAQLPAPHSAA